MCAFQNMGAKFSERISIWFRIKFRTLIDGHAEINTNHYGMYRDYQVVPDF